MAKVVDEPTWPEGDAGRILLHLDLEACSVDALFDDLFGSYSDFQSKLHAVRGDSNCFETPWVGSREELPAAQYTWSPPPSGAPTGTPAAGKMRKVRFDAPPAPLASKGFSNEEIQKVQVYSPGSHYNVESEVYTNALYGDKFVIISRYTLVARAPRSTTLHLSYTIVFHPSVSRMMRPMVQKGVEGGIRGTFNHCRRILGAMYQVTDVKDGTPAPVVSEQGVLPPPLPPREELSTAAAAPMPAPLWGLSDYLVYQSLVGALASWPDPALLAGALALLATVAALQALLWALAPLRSVCADPGGRGASWVCAPFGALDLPDTLGEVLASVALVWAANKALMLGAGALGALLREAGYGRHVAHVHTPVAADAPNAAAPNGDAPASDASPSDASPAAATAPPPTPTTSAPARMPTFTNLFVRAPTLKAPVDSVSTPLPGSGAPAAPPDRSLRSRPPRARAAAGDAASAAVTAAAAAGGAAATAQPSPAAASGAASLPPLAPPDSRTASPSPGALPPSPATTPSAGVAPDPNGGTVFKTALASWGKNLWGNDVTDSVSVSSERFSSYLTGAWQRTQDTAKQLIHTSESSSPQANSVGGASVNNGTGGGAAPAVTSPTGAAAGVSGSSGGGRHRPSSSFTATLDPSGLVLIEDYAQANPSLPDLAEEGNRSSKGSPSKGNSATSLAAAAAAGGAAGAAAAGAAHPSRPSSVMSRLRQGAGSAEPPSPAGEDAAAGIVPGEEDADEVEEEVFEFERVQPFRGWGHTWPGHFLPSDRVGHWGSRSGAPGGSAAQLFDKVAPKCPRGWDWREPEWRVEYSALAWDGVDADGWSYLLDFTLMRWPPAPGAGRYTLQKFVRTRRWVRTRVRVPGGGEAAPLRLATPARRAGAPGESARTTAAGSATSEEAREGGGSGGADAAATAAAVAAPVRVSPTPTAGEVAPALEVPPAAPSLQHQQAPPAASPVPPSPRVDGGVATALLDGEDDEPLLPLEGDAAPVPPPRIPCPAPTTGVGGADAGSGAVDAPATPPSAHASALLGAASAAVIPAPAAASSYDLPSALSVLGNAPAAHAAAAPPHAAPPPTTPAAAEPAPAASDTLHAALPADGTPSAGALEEDPFVDLMAVSRARSGGNVVGASPTAAGAAPQRGGVRMVRSPSGTLSEAGDAATAAASAGVSVEPGTAAAVGAARPAASRAHAARAPPAGGVDSGVTAASPQAAGASATGAPVGGFVSSGPAAEEGGAASGASDPLARSSDSTAGGAVSGSALRPSVEVPPQEEDWAKW